MKKFQFNGTITDYFKAFLYTMAGLLTTLINPAGLIFLGMAGLGRFGGMNKYIAYIAVGATVGFATGAVSFLASSVTGFLPGILGTIAGYLITGFVITFLVGIILKAFGARK